MNKQLLERTIKRLEEKLMIDKEYMEADDVEQLLNDIDSLKSMLPTEKHELYGCYCPSYDMTFVIKATYIGSDLHTEECVGWYHGEPTDEDNVRYSNNNLLATYDWNN